MIKCRQVSELLTSDQLSSQPWWRRLEVRLHLAMCKFCARLARQLEQIRAAAREPLPGSDADPGLDDRILRRLSGR